VSGEPGIYSYFDVRFEKKGFGPVLYIPYLWSIVECDSVATISPTDVVGDDIRWFWGDGTAHTRIYFDASPGEICKLQYFSGFGFISFEFE
jgi:hypothetical protein